MIGILDAAVLQRMTIVASSRTSNSCPNRNMSHERGRGWLVAWLLACLVGWLVTKVGCTPGLTTNRTINQPTTGTKPLHEPMLTTRLGVPMWRIKNGWQPTQQRAPDHPWFSNHSVTGKLRMFFWSVERSKQRPH